jgi:hypothetical protein
MRSRQTLGQAAQAPGKPRPGRAEATRSILDLSHARRLPDLLTTGGALTPAGAALLSLDRLEQTAQVAGAELERRVAWRWDLGSGQGRW